MDCEEKETIRPITATINDVRERLNDTHIHSRISMCVYITICFRLLQQDIKVMILSRIFPICILIAKFMIHLLPLYVVKKFN